MTMTPEDATRFAADLDRLVAAVEEVLLGKNRIVRLAFTALLSVPPPGSSLPFSILSQPWSVM